MATVGTDMTFFLLFSSWYHLLIITLQHFHILTARLGCDCFFYLCPIQMFYCISFQPNLTFNINTLFKSTVKKKVNFLSYNGFFHSRKLAFSDQSFEYFICIMNSELSEQLPALSPQSLLMCLYTHGAANLGFDVFWLRLNRTHMRHGDANISRPQLVSLLDSGF